MATRGDYSAPNLALYNLRDSRGASQQDIAASLNGLATSSGKSACVTANQVSRWERGIARPSPFYRQLLARHFGVSVDELGLLRPRTAQDQVPATFTAGFEASHADVIEVHPVVTASQNEWRDARRTLNQHRTQLARAVASLYGPELTLPGTGLLVDADWLPAVPVPLSDVEIEHDDKVPSATAGSVEEITRHLRPLVVPERRFHRYSQAIKAVSPPRLFENRMAWRLQDVAWAANVGHMSFADTTYFDTVDLCEALAHEAAQALVRSDGHILTPTWRSLPARQRVGDPFDLSGRMVATSTDTLTIRRHRDGSTFVLHDRGAGNVAVAGGMLHVMPCGVFQPSSIRPAAQEPDFDLWRNIIREYSEEFLGNPEHDGDGAPINYEDEPFAQFNKAVQAGKARAYCLGVGLDALTLFGEILTVVVFEAETYDQLFAGMVDSNDEGVVVKTGQVHPTPAIPFSEHTIHELIDSGRLAPAAAGCLQLAWDHRRILLDT